jgi:hypothetical protein
MSLKPLFNDTSFICISISCYAWIHHDFLATRKKKKENKREKVSRFHHHQLFQEKESFPFPSNVHGNQDALFAV